MHGGVTDVDATLSHHLFEIPHTQPIRHIPAHARQDYIEQVMQTFEHTGYCRIQGADEASALEKKIWKLSNCCVTVPTTRPAQTMSSNE